MNHELRLRSRLCVAAFALASAGAAAQGVTARLYCHTVGNGTAEALGDREGHTIAAGQFTCRVEGGPGDGGVLTGTNIVEWDKAQGVVLSGSGVTRKPGAVTAYQIVEAKSSLLMTDGKVTGVTGAGRGRFTLATGAAAAYAGKGFSYTLNTTGPGQFVVDVKYD